MRHIFGLSDHNDRPFHHGLCTLSKALARLRSGLLFRPALVVRVLGMIQERWSAIVDGIYSLEPQRIRLSGLGQSCDLQLLRTTGYDHECSGSTLGTLERCQRPVPVRPSELLLVLDASSAWGEETVVWNVIRTHTRSRNMCNIKIATSRSRLQPRSWAPTGGRPPSHHSPLHLLKVGRVPMDRSQ